MSTPGIKARCSHCGKSAAEVEQMFSSRFKGSNAHICNECLLNFYELYVQHQLDLQRIEDDRYLVAERVATALEAFIADHHTGHIVVRVGHRPDIALFRRDQLTADHMKRILEQATFEVLDDESVPNLVVHVAGFLRLGQDAANGQLYLARGVSLVWIIRPRARCVEEWRRVTQEALSSRRDLMQADTLEGFDMLPGFHHEISDIFEGVW